MQIEKVFENQDIIAVNKPSGLLSIPDRFDKNIPNLSEILHKKFGKLYKIHRIDKATSGLIIFAKNPTAHRHFSMQFEERKVEKIYHALTFGTPPKNEDDIYANIIEHPTIKGKMAINKKGKYAHSKYQTLKVWPGISYLQIQIFTGRTHQIRLHLSSIGTPIIGDNIYGSGEYLYLSHFKKHFKLPGNFEEEKPLMGRLALHAFSMIITDENGLKLNLSAPIPKDFRASISQLNKW